MRSHWQVLKQTAAEFIEDDALRLSAALAYYSVFSIAPLLVICVAIAGIFFGQEAVRGQLDEQLRSALGASGAFAVQDMVANARKPEASMLASIGGIVMLVVGAGGVFGQLQEALNTIWGVQPKPGRGVVGLVKDRFLSFTMVLGTGFLLLTSMILTAALQAASTWMRNIAELPPPVWDALGTAFSLAIIVVLFAAIFKVLPDARIRWRDVWTGAFATALLFVIGKAAIGWYLGREATSSSYGAAGSLALVLLWVYYSSIILLFGAEFTQVWANSRGHQIEPNAYAERAND